MAITKGDVKLEQVMFTFDDAGNVDGLRMDVNFAYLEDGTVTVRQRKPVDLWPNLTVSQRTQTDTLVKRLMDIAATTI